MSLRGVTILLTKYKKKQQKKNRKKQHSSKIITQIYTNLCLIYNANSSAEFVSLYEEFLDDYMYLIYFLTPNLGMSTELLYYFPFFLSFFFIFVIR